jgi:hypothetical protein
MAIASLTAQLPSLAGALPDLFRRPDSAPVRDDDTATASQTPANDASRGNERRALMATSADDAARQVARRAALGPLTYGRRMASDAPPAAPIGMRGAHLDVRG